MRDIFEDIQKYLQTRNLQKSANLASLTGSSPTAAAATAPSSHFTIGGIPIPESALNTPEGLRLAMEWSEKQKQGAPPSFDPNNPFAWLQLRGAMEDLTARRMERALSLQATLAQAALQQRMMMRALLEDAAARRQQMFATLLQAFMLPALERYRIMAEMNRPHQTIVAGGAPPPPDRGAPIPEFVRVRV
jgi:hypothetical protein